MTKKEMFAKAIEVIAGVEVEEKDALIEGLKHEIELLEKRSSGKRTPTKTQKENEVIMEKIVVALTEIGEPVTVTDLIDKSEGLGYTCQKISALLRKLIEAGKVVKHFEGKKSYFSVA